MKPTKAILLAFLVLAFVATTAFADESSKDSSRPNIVWIIADDMSDNFSCYGETAIETPHVDRLATRGVKFTQAFVTAPVCSPCRSAFITGMYQTSIGAHHHRSGQGKLKIALPNDIVPIPKWFQDAGYFTSIGNWPDNGKGGKTDYNFQWDSDIYDGSHWSQRKKDQPFFAQIQISGGKLRGNDEQGWDKVQKAAEKTFGKRTPDDAVKLPPYYPSHPDIIRDWAAYLDAVRMTDATVGEVVAQLDADGLLENTIVIFMTDHGISHARGKQFLYDEGLRIPLVISGPGIMPGTVRDDLVQHIDIAALSLAAAGIAIPKYMQSQDILAKDYQPRQAVFAARDRCDETVDHIRSVRTKDFKYIRNFLPQRPYLQPCRYKDGKTILKAIREYHTEGKLNPTQSLVVRETRPEEELYEVNADPFEINNLASDPAYSQTLAELRGRLDSWMEETQDQGRESESEAMYDSDMAAYFRKYQGPKGNSAEAQKLRDNIALMKKWASEGK